MPADPATRLTALAGDLAPGLQWAASRGGARRVLAAGVTEAGGAAVTPDTRFLSASMTKLATAVLALGAAWAGEIDLDAPVGALGPLPGAGPWAGATPAMLLAHAGGFRDPAPLRWVHPAGAPFDEAAALSARLGRLRPATPPGTATRYSNLGFWLLGLAVERAAGQPLPRLLRERIAAPLGLPEGALGFDPPPPGAGARGHLRRGGPMHLLARLALRDQLDDAGGGGRWVRMARLAMDGPAYGGLFATAGGYLALLEDLLAPRPRLLPAAARDRLLAPSPFPGHGGAMSAGGLRIAHRDGRRVLSKPGGGPGFCGNLRLVPEEGAASVWLANALATSERRIEALSDRIEGHGA